MDIQLKDVRKRLARERMTLELSDSAVQSLALDGLDPVYGARPLKRLIQRRVVDQVANLIIAGELHEGDTVRIDTDADGNLVAERVKGNTVGDSSAGDNGGDADSVNAE